MGHGRLCFPLLRYTKGIPWFNLAEAPPGNGREVSRRSGINRFVISPRRYGRSLHKLRRERVILKREIAPEAGLPCTRSAAMALAVKLKVAITALLTDTTAAQHTTVVTSKLRQTLSQRQFEVADNSRTREPSVTTSQSLIHVL